MAAPSADQRHPAFNKLFIESEYLPELGALLFRRRPRAKTKPQSFWRTWRSAPATDRRWRATNRKNARLAAALMRAIGNVPGSRP